MAGRKLNSRKRIAAAIAVIAATSVVAGLGGSGAAAGASYQLEVGIFSPFTGPNSIYGYFNYDGCVPAVRLINQSGGVLGHKLYCQIVDNRGEPADAVPAAQNMIASSSHLVAIVDGNSGLLSPTVPLFNKAQIPELSLGGDVQFDKNTYQYFWRTTPGDDQAGYALAAYVKFKTPYTKVAAIFGNDQAAQGNVPGLVAGAKKLKLKIVSNQAIALDQTSYQTEVQKLKASHPQIIATESDPQTAGVLLANLKQSNALGPIVGTSGTVGTDYNKAAIAALGRKTFEAGFVRVIQFTATSGTAWNAWKASLLQSGAQVKNPASIETGFAPEIAYDHTVMVALAMLAAHSTVGSKFNSYIGKITQGKVVVRTYAQGKAALAAGKTIDFVGLEGQVTFDKYHNSGGVWAVGDPVTNQSKGMISAHDIALAEGH